MKPEDSACYAEGKYCRQKCGDSAVPTNAAAGPSELPASFQKARR